MIDLLAELLAASRDLMVVAGVVFLRVGAMMFLLPAFGEQLIPLRVRLGLTLAFTAIVTPAVAPLIVTPPSFQAGLVLFLATETAVGLTLGIMVRLFVMALQIAGTIAAQSTSLSQILGDVGVDPQPAIGQLMTLGGLTLAVILGLHIRAAELMIHSYDVFPPGRAPGARLLGEWGVARIAAAFSLAFSLAAPFTIASFIYNLALGIINRAMPQLMVTFIGAPAITFGGLALLLITTPILLGIWHAGLAAFLFDPFEGN